MCNVLFKAKNVHHLYGVRRLCFSSTEINDLDPSVPEEVSPLHCRSCCHSAAFPHQRSSFLQSFAAFSKLIFAGLVAFLGLLHRSSWI